MGMDCITNLIALQLPLAVVDGSICANIEEREEEVKEKRSIFEKKDVPEDEDSFYKTKKVKRKSITPKSWLQDVSECVSQTPVLK